MARALGVYCASPSRLGRRARAQPTTGRRRFAEDSRSTSAAELSALPTSPAAPRLLAARARPGLDQPHGRARRSAHAVLRGGGTPSDNATLTTYEQARAFLNEADSFAREATTYAESLTSAPQREAEIQRRLDERDEAYNPAREIEGLTADGLTARLAQASARAARAPEPAPDPGPAPHGRRRQRDGHSGQARGNRSASRRVAGRRS